MKIEIYVEGGGPTRILRQKCRQGFSEFFRKAGMEGRMPKVIASGSRQNVFKDFRTALRTAGKGDFIVLLVDSEGPVKSDPGGHLEMCDNWNRPAGAADEQVHLMVQCMEAWFLADQGGLEAYFGNSFSQNVLPARRNIENIAKRDVLKGLENATRSCRPKGKYDKGRHSFDILAQIDPNEVVAASRHAKRLVNTLKEKVSAAG